MKASDNPFPTALFTEQAAAPTTPAAGYWRAYFKSDGLYAIDDAGTETGPFGTGGAATAYKGVRVRQASAGSHGTSGSWLAIGFDTEDWDTDSFHDTATNTSRVTIPAGLGGKYRVSFFVEFGGSATGVRGAQIRYNGAYDAAKTFGDTTAGFAGVGNMLAATMDVSLTAGDYLEVFAYQNTGGSLAYNSPPQLAVEYLGA